MNGTKRLPVRLLVWLAFLPCAPGCSGGGRIVPEASSASRCELGRVEQTDGYRRLAFVVGVGDYQAEKVTDLDGPPQDAQRFYDLLTREKGGYGFPTTNVCLLLDGEATSARFRDSFRKALTERVTGENDVAVLYFAGHGSQRRDGNGDEPDEWDETLMLHDSRTSEVPGDFPDDELNELLAELHKKTRHIAVVLDSCNSGSATRFGAGNFVARFQPPADEVADSIASARGDSGASWVPEDLDGLVAFVAATDGTSALERNGRGIFTDALLTVLSQATSTPLTYAQAARQIPLLVSANSYQVPLFEGDLARTVFGNESRNRPASWEVIAVSDGGNLELSGPPLPGIGVGAELRVYVGSARGVETLDPAKAKAIAVVTQSTGLNVGARVAGDASSIAIGDLATLARVADDFTRVTVGFRAAQDPGGLAPERAAALRDDIENDAEASLLVTITDGGADFELGLSSDGTLELRGPANRVLNRYEKGREASDVPKSLWQHARQRALLQLHGEGGEDFADQETLQVRLVPAARQNHCADGQWLQSEPNDEQVTPLCHSWNVEVTLKKNAPMPLLVGGFVLSNDGAIFGFPADGRKELLEPGHTVTFSRERETFRAGPPLDVQDHVLVFGTQETNPVEWHLFTQTSATRSGIRAPGSLHRAIDRYLQPGTRSQTVDDTPKEDTTWTMTRVAVRAEANSRFLSPEQARAAGDEKREYTIPMFDIRPYLPDNGTSALYKVLMKAHSLATYSAERNDGVPYAQHDWAGRDDPANLAIGIDCSRSIWYAFTRADLSYNNRENTYLPTALMVGAQSLMAENFVSCDDSGLQLGDVLVYRDDQRSVGHTVMVIDPVKRIAWGSHGWDGNVNEGREKDSGVEYQLIKYKKDWERWDRPTLTKKACWRYRQFIDEADTPGLLALGAACDPGRSCGLPKTDPIDGGGVP